MESTTNLDTIEILFNRNNRANEQALLQMRAIIEKQAHRIRDLEARLEPKKAQASNKKGD